MTARLLGHRLTLVRARSGLPYEGESGPVDFGQAACEDLSASPDQLNQGIVGVLDQELQWVPQVQKMFGDPGTANGYVQDPFTDTEIALQTNLQDAAANLEQAIQAPASEKVSVDLIDVLAVAFDIAGSDDDACDETCPLIAGLLWIADGISHSSSGGGGDVSLRIQTTVDQVAEMLAQRLIDTKDQMTRAGEILVSDYGKLQAAAAATKTDPDGQSKWWNTRTSPGDVRDELIGSSRGLVSAHLLPLVYEAWVLLPTAKQNVTTAQDYKCELCLTTCEKPYPVPPFQGEPDSGQLPFIVDWTGTPGQLKPQYVLWALGTDVTKVALQGPPPHFPRCPPASITDPIFAAFSPKIDESAGMGLQKLSFFVDNFSRRTLECNGGLDFGPILPPGTPVPDH